MFFILLLLIILSIIYNLLGVLEVIKLMVWILNYLVSTILLTQNPDNFWIRFVQLTSLFISLFIIFSYLKQLIWLFI